jgi:hypothetical protein
MIIAIIRNDIAGNELRNGGRMVEGDPPQGDPSNNAVDIRAETDNLGNV